MNILVVGSTGPQCGLVIGNWRGREATRDSATCQEWFSHGVFTSRILPTICAHRWSVSRVSFHAAYGNSGHTSTSDDD